MTGGPRGTSPPLDLQAVEMEIAEYVGAGGRWLLIVERVPALLAHARALRATLEFIASTGLDCPIGLSPEVFYRRQAEGMIANAVAVLGAAQDGPA